jgi:hypothetical protein
VFTRTKILKAKKYIVQLEVTVKEWFLFDMEFEHAEARVSRFLNDEYVEPYIFLPDHIKVSITPAC